MAQLTQPLCSEKEFCVNLVSTCADLVPGPALRATRQVPAVRMRAADQPARARATAEVAPAVTVPGRCRKSELCNNVHRHRGQCNQKRKRSAIAHA